MKRFAAILSSALLVWMQMATLSACASASPVCPKATVDNCAASCAGADCCVAHPSPDSKPAPAVPAQSNAQNQISLLASAMLIWTLPKNASASISSAATSALTAAKSPLFARNCALLL